MVDAIITKNTQKQKGGENMGLNEREIIQAQRQHDMIKRHGKFRYKTNRRYKDERLIEKPTAKHGPLWDVSFRYGHNLNGNYDEF